MLTNVIPCYSTLRAKCQEIDYYLELKARGYT